MRMQRIGLLIAMAAITLLGACGGSGAASDDSSDTLPPTSTDWPTPTDSPTATPTAPPLLCAYPSGTAPTMIYPAQGATNVPDDLQDVEVVDAAGSYPVWLPASGNYYYADLFTHPATGVTESNFHGPQSTGFQVDPTTATRITLNSGSFTAGGQIVAHTHYYVYLEYSYQDGSSNQCYANGPIGDFTTQ